MLLSILKHYQVDSMSSCGVIVRMLLSAADAGIVTSALASLLGQSRLYVVLGRERLLPSGLAKVHAVRATPVNATVLAACTAGDGPPTSDLALHRIETHPGTACTSERLGRHHTLSFVVMHSHKILLNCDVCSEGGLALVMDLEALAQLVSLSTLVSFYCTAAALLWRRHCDGSPASRHTTAVRLSCSIAFSLCKSLCPDTLATAVPSCMQGLCVPTLVMSACSTHLMLSTACKVC